jgi:hypothetical protein
LYKEDFNKFIKALAEAVDYVKTDLMPDFDFDAFNHEYPEGEEGMIENDGAENNDFTAAPVIEEVKAPVIVAETVKPVVEEIKDDFINPTATEEVDKW